MRAATLAGPAPAVIQVHGTNYVREDIARDLFTMLEEVDAANARGQSDEQRQTLAIEVHTALGQYQRAIGEL